MRLTITLEMPDRCPTSGKARLRHSLKLMGATEVRIVEVKVEAAARPVKPDNTPTSPEALACAALFGRKPEQEWSDVEIDLFRKARNRNVITIESMNLMKTYYTAERKKGRDPQTGGIDRRDLKTLLANIDGENDRALAHSASRSSRRGEWLPTEPKLSVLPPPMTAEEEEAAARFTADMEARKQRAL